MLSDHELVEAVRKLHPKAKKIQEKCSELFKKKYPSERGGLIGLRGVDELDYTIQHLESSAAVLKRLRDERRGEVNHV